ncbi:RAMP superfamily CRISPR-associated protein [Dickeya oryzae]|uniref:RAMP superfamily CRISPR-associated protein n=1 Tax=Dickeya oryzae TaxID=1240404 RepID=UPI00209759F7|nr:RAMP superfamily CRISPR-associated protein [Dickeya oryzae]MCO7255745.1 RAMP superfamily CRISPR-associated protein [Dickeya oryzae]
MNRLRLARLLLETTSPLAINSAERAAGFDTALARDANHLPYLPATSLAGVWRHWVTRHMGDAVADAWFGSLEPDASASRLFIQNGLLINSRHQPVQGLLSDDEIAQDNLLNQLVQPNPHHREQVRINDRGVAQDTGKYDQILLPAGLRFCVDIRWHPPRTPHQQDDTATQQQQWRAILTAFTDPLFRLGSHTRNGLGRLRLVASELTELPLQNAPAQGEVLRRLTRRDTLPVRQDLQPDALATAPFARLTLQARDGWRAGVGYRPVSEDTAPETDRFTYSEPVVVWQQQADGNWHGKWRDTPQVVLCASAIKGTLAHRLAFHYRCLQQEFAETEPLRRHEQWQQRPDGLRDLLGSSPQDDTLLAGKLWVDDVIIHEVQTLVRHYNSLDRFTGGVRQGRLFSEELLWQPRFEVILRLSPHTRVSPTLRDALKLTLADLQDGLLPLGAGSGRGTSLVAAVPDAPWHIDWNQLGELDELDEPKSPLNDAADDTELTL